MVAYYDLRYAKYGMPINVLEKATLSNWQENVLIEFRISNLDNISL